MANRSRQAIVARAIQARSPNGGTTAPNRPRASSGSGGTSYPGPGIGTGRPVGRPGGGLGQSRPVPRPVAAPVAPATPGVPPWNAKYEETVSGAKKKYLNTSGNLDLAETAAKQDYGLDPGYNDYKVNPNSRAALLEEKFQQGNRGVANSAGLNLYSGSTSNRLFNNRTANAQNRDALAKSYRESLGGISSERTKAKEEKDETERGAYWDWIGEGEKAPLDPGTAPEGRKQQTAKAIKSAAATKKKPIAAKAFATAIKPKKGKGK